MKFLLFDENAITTYINESRMQSTEYQEGLRLVRYLHGEISSEKFYNTFVEYSKDGIIFVGQKNNSLILRIWINTFFVLI